VVPLSIGREVHLESPGRFKLISVRLILSDATVVDPDREETEKLDGKIAVWFAVRISRAVCLNRMDAGLAE
jgi:hypothetical protein